MRSSRSKLLISLALAAAILTWAIGQGFAQSQATLQSMHQETQKSAQQRRQEANERLDAWLEGREPPPPAAPKQATAAVAGVRAAAATPTGINPAVDITLPNYANSPSIRKFVNSLPGLAINPLAGDPSVNNLGQYIPVAVPDTITYPGSDFYVIGLVEYSEKMHSDLPPTKLRGYVQLNGGDPLPHYLGPVILARKNRPVRVKFTNLLPKGAGGNLFLPVDTTIMGAGMGPAPMPGMPGMMESYTQNRATLHLHGGLTPWISDGTPHQWTVPAGEVTSYPKGVSVVNVPDMPAPGPGSLTFYWTNQQSARLMFYHDHAYGITRLNVYAGEAAGYLLTDQVEEDLISGTNFTGGNPANKQILPNLGGLYRYGIPLVIQDKTFVNDATTPPGAGFPGTYAPTDPTAATDLLWYTHVPGSTGGNLWFPHEYLPNENIYSATGFNDMGRWDYAPWMIPPMTVLNNTLPSPTAVPEAFMDTMVVNGTALPYVELPPTAVRFRILNACNDRMLNLQLYTADPAHPTEVRMVPASPNPAYPTWPVDGRYGGVPDPTMAGPSIIQIGNECGFLAKAAVIPPQPVDFDYNRRSVTYGGVTSKSLLLPPAVRADVVVDLSSYKDGDTVILYNDAPAPMPLYDTRYDYFTDDPDQTGIGGAPSTPIGFGPNTRTILQIRIKGVASTPFDVASLQTALPKAFAVAQDAPIVHESAFNSAYGTTYPDSFANAADETLNVSGATQSVARVVTELPSFGYTTPPAISFYGGGGTGAAATASLNGVTGITLVTAGSGYATAPTVTITPAVGDTGTGATAVATVSGGVVTAITVTNLGSNYLLAPTVNITGGGGTGATAQATVTMGSVGAITLTNAGSGYSKAPYVTLTGGGGTGAVARAMLNGDLVLDGKNLVEGFDMEFGRMNAVLGSTPNPLTPAVGAGPVVGAAFYIDPPTEILNADQPILWRIMHVGVDSHALHFHLFNVQVINRVDWTNTLKPPYTEEVGWKETIRTNPFEDIIVAVRPTASAMKLPFGLPNSNRLLDPTMPAGSTANFTPVPPPPGLPGVAQLANVVTNFGWEYVWHCHLLGHEENDMMRPLVFKVPSTAPAAPVVTAQFVSGVVKLTWTDPTPFNYATGLPTSTLGNPRNEIGFLIERATGTTGAYTQIGTALANATSYNDTTAISGTTYRYRVGAWNVAGTTRSTVVSVSSGHTVTVTATATPTTVASGGKVSLSSTATDSLGHTGLAYAWRDNGAGGTFSSTTSRNPSYTAPVNTSGSPMPITLTVTATCKWQSPWVTGSANLAVTVQSAAHAVVVTAAASPATIPSAGASTLFASAVDSLGHGIASWSWSSGGAGGTFSPSASVQNPTYTAAANTSGANRTVTLTCTATCVGPSAVNGKASTTLTVQPAATSHTVAVTVACSPTTLASGGSSALSGSALDSSGHGIATWSWSDGGAGGTFSPSAAVPSPTYIAAANTTGASRTVTLTLTATCNGASPAHASGSTTLTVQRAGTHTVTVTATATPNPVASGGATALLATGTDSMGHGGLAYNWSDGGAGGTFSSITVRNPTYTAPVNTTGSPKVITLVVTATCKWQAPWVAGTTTVNLTVTP